MHPPAVLILGSLFALALGPSKALGALSANSTYPVQPKGTTGMGFSLRVRRSIDEVDKLAIVELHNKLRGEVRPTASNMEHMVRALQQLSSMQHPNILTM